MRSPQPEPIPASAWFGPAVGHHELDEMLAFLGANNGAAVLSWPRDRHHRDRLDAAGIPRLFLVPPGEEPPVRGLLEDSVCVPVSQTEIHRRLVRLCRSAATRRLHAAPPAMAGDGRLDFGGHHVDIPQCAAGVATALVGAFERPVPAAELLAALPPEARTSLHLAARVARLTTRVEMLGLEAVEAGHDAYVLRRCRTLQEWAPTHRTRPALRPVA
jgi:hypothetical protein